MADQREGMDSQPPSMAGPREGMDSVDHDVFEKLESIKKSMCRSVINGNWQKVVEIFVQNPEARDAKITESGETALHIAVSEGQVDVVRQLVEPITPENVNRVLRAKNERGNTPLHLAAALGTVVMCYCIAKKDPHLIGTRNHDGETPLFLAVLNGKTKAFLCLHEQSPKDAIDGCSYCRRTSDGDTILHCAIFQEYFGLAYQIIQCYKDLVDSKNEQGQTPLHVLATKPSASKSASGLGIYEQIIYHCVFADPLPVETLSKEDYEDDSEDKRSSKYPYNYRTCVNFFWWLMMIIKVLVRGAKNNGNPPDVENPDKASRDGSQGGSGPIRPQLHEGESSNATQNRSSEPAKDENPNYQRSRLVPPNIETLLLFFRLVIQSLLIVLGLGFIRAQKIQDKKEKHEWAIQIMEELLKKTSVWDFNAGLISQKSPLQKDDETMDYDIHAASPDEYASSNNPKGSDTTTRNINQATNEEREKKATDKNIICVLLEGRVKILAVDDTTRKEEGKRETPILLAAKYGVLEMVEKILNKFPVAIHDLDSNKKNVVLLAVENRQAHVYNFLLKFTFTKESVFRKLDTQGNSALHLAATLGKHKPWRTPGAALQMQWELKWYKFVKDSMPRHYFVRYNTKGLTPEEVFNETHKDLIKEGGKWLISTSKSCSVVAALISTVAFATSSTIPGGVKQDYGMPTLQGRPAFGAFAISSLVALCFSVTSLVMFLAVLTSRYQEKDFARNLPTKLIFGLSSLFISIAAILVSFCSGHIFVVEDNLKYVAYPVYAITGLPVTFFAFAQFPLYVDLIKSTFLKVPQRSSDQIDEL